MIRCILFDNDGVVSYESEFFSEFYARTYNVPVEGIRYFFTNTFPDCMTGKKDLKQELEPLLPEWKWTGTVDDFLRYWFEKENIVNEKVLSVVQLLKHYGVICCLATNQEQHRVNYLRKKYGHVFNHIYSSAEIGCKKNNTQFWKAVAEDVKIRFKVNPRINADEILLVDDEEQNIDAASQIISAHQFTSVAELEQMLKAQKLINEF